MEKNAYMITFSQRNNRLKWTQVLKHTKVLVFFYLNKGNTMFSFLKLLECAFLLKPSFSLCVFPARPCTAKVKCKKKLPLARKQATVFDVN